MVIAQRIRNKITTISERITGEDKSYFPFRQIAPNDCSMIISQRFFFSIFPSFSFAASK